MGGFVSKDDSCPQTQGPVKTINHDKMLQNIDDMFKSVHATQVTDLPLADEYSSTSDIDVSTIRPMKGGASFNYTRNRYQKYEDKLKTGMKGGDGNLNAPGTQATPVASKSTNEVVDESKNKNANYLDVDIADFDTAEADIPSASNEADIAAQREELKKMMEAAADSLDEDRENRDPLKRPEQPVERPEEAEGFDIGRQMGGMTVDREVESIRSLLLNTNKAQRGGNGINNDANGMDQDMDDSLRMVRDTLLNNQMGGNMVFSATSDNSVNINELTLSATSENPIDYNLLMRGGAKNKKNQNKIDSEQSGGEIDDDSTSTSTTETESESENEDSSESEISSTTTKSENDFSDLGIDVTDIMRLQKGIDKRQNRSNFLRGDYVMTSNSDHNYKISGRPYFSSQSSEYQNEVASEFLNTIRSRNRA